MFTTVLTNQGFYSVYCCCCDGFSLYLMDRLRSRRAVFNKNIVISSQCRAIVLIMNQISFICPGMLRLFYKKMYIELEHKNMYIGLRSKGGRYDMCH